MQLTLNDALDTQTDLAGNGKDPSRRQLRLLETCSPQPQPPAPQERPLEDRLPLGQAVAHILEPDRYIGVLYAYFKQRVGVFHNGYKDSYLPKNLLPWSPPAEGLAEKLGRLQDELAVLQIERDKLQPGPIAPDHCWIECNRCWKRQFRQAFYKSNRAIFDSKRGQGKVKRQYIGKENGSEHQAAKVAIANRNRLKQILKRMATIRKELEAIDQTVQPDKQNRGINER